MAQVEPMDIDAIDSDFDNKENTYQHSNVLSRTPCTEKGYEELDVSELNMKLRYSFTPVSSPMSKSLTGCLDNRNCNHGEDYLNAAATDNGNLTRSLNSTFSKNDSTKSKILPLQTLTSDPFVNNNRSSSTHRLMEPNDSNVTISVSTNNVDDNLSIASSSSSMAQTPEATTPTKEIPKPEGSPILRGLKNVLSMFRPSQSPIPPVDGKTSNQDDILSPTNIQLAGSVNESNVKSVKASTPVNVCKQKEVNTSKRSSPLKESVVFSDDLERELQWKDETTIIFKQEKIPLHKMLSQNPLTPEESKKAVTEKLNTTVEYMDISCNESILTDKVTTHIEPSTYSHKNDGATAVESDNEFLDCESTFIKNENGVSDTKDLVVENKILSDNVTIQTCENLEMSETKDEVNNSHIKEPDNVNIKSLKDILSSGYHIEFGNKSREIIEATTNFIKNEICSNIKEEPNLLIKNLQTEEKITYNMQQLKVNVTMDDSLTKNEVVTKELENMPVMNKIENLEEKVSLTTHNKTEDNAVAMLLNNEKKCDSDCDNVPNSTVNTDLMPFSTNNHEQNMSNTENAQVIPLEINKELSGASEILLDKSVNEVDSSIINKIENGEEVIDLITEEKVTECAKTEEYVSQNTIDVIKSNLSVTHSDLGSLQNVDTIDKEVKEVEANNFLDTSNIAVNNDGNINIVKMSEGNNKLLQDNIIEAYNTTCNSFTNNFASLDKDCEMCELTLENNVIGKLPPEIPLPDDDDDIEKPIMETNNFTEEVVEGQNVRFELNSEKLNIHNEINTDSAAEFKYNSEKECSKTSPVTVINEHREVIVMDNNGTSKVENCNDIQLQHGSNDKENEVNVSEEDKNKNNTANCSSESMLQLSVSEIQNEHINILSGKQLTEALTNTQKKNSINADDLRKQDTDNVCEITMKLTENENSGTNFVIDTEIVSGTSQEDTNIDFIKSPNLENQMCYSKESGVEKHESNSEVNNDQGSGAGEPDEEIVTSANNSPYVSVTELALDIEPNPQDPKEEFDNPLTAQSKVDEFSPLSPKIVSKGYNFNFDEIHDPFTTVTKIRMSPTPESPKQSKNLEEDLKKTEEIPKQIISNRRKSQLDKKRLTQKKTLNSTVIGNSITDNNASKKNNKKRSDVPPKDNMDLSTKQLNTSDPKSKPENTEIAVAKDVGVTSHSEIQNISLPHCFVGSASFSPNLDDPSIQKEEIVQIDGEIKHLEQTLVISDQKSTSSSEQYFSLGTSSGESVGLMNPSKNVFNIPEIDDVNFNPFATKTKMRMSPPPCESKISGIEDINNANTNSSLVLQQKDESDIDDVTINKTVTKASPSPNASNVTSSSKATNDKDTTVCEIPTEDEDTIEGPFLEADDLKHIRKLNDMDVANDMMNFDDVPTQELDENLDNGELFIDADAFELLLNQNKNTTVLDSGKESLFLKFDPLFAKRVSSDGVLAALSKVQKRQSTPKKPATNLQQPPKDTPNANIPVAGPSNDRENNVPVLEEYSDDLSSYAMTKPMMVVNPAVSSIMSPRKVAATPKINRRSLTFTSPAMAVIDRLLSLSGNAPHLNDESYNMSREHNETDFAITQLRELLAEKEIHVHNLRCESKELKERLAALEVQVRSLETESAERLMKINDLNERLSDKTKINKSMATVVEEYERTIASLIAESEQDKKRHAEERIRLIKERDEQTAHLTSMEVSFSDLHSKYEKSKQIILNCKANEDTYKKSLKEFEENFSKMQTNYELLKQHATSKLNHANKELEKMNRAHEAEVLKLNALIKRKDLDITSLEESLSQKTKANEELTAICDELINKVG